jgi:hypothetical protein
MRTGFLLAEDEAIKARFSNLFVTDDRNERRPVQVFFRYPEGETERDYPFITVELIDVLHATERQLSDQGIYIDTTGSGLFTDRPAFVEYWPSESASVSGSATMSGSPSFLIADDFIPVDLLYQVSIYTRSALHDRQLTSGIIRRVAPFRWNSINIPADGTVRRFDLLDWTNADLLDMESGYRKRIFRKVLTLKMSSEITGQDLDSLQGTEPVQEISSTITSQLHVFNV